MTTPAFPAGTILGYPRIGRRRELKRALEQHWAGEIDEAELDRVTAELRRATRERLATLGLGRGDSAIPESFSCYDQVLDAALTVGALPESGDAAAGSDRVGAETCPHRVEQHHLQPPAVHRQLRVGVARSQSAGFGEQQLAAMGVEADR